MIMKHIKFLAILMASVLVLASCGQKVIKTKVPARPAGQEDVIGLTADPIDTVRIGVVGLGMRGSFAVYRLSNEPWSKITAVCDVEPDRTDASAKYLIDHGFEAPAKYSGEDGYKQLCESDNVDLVYVCTDWVHHVPVALCAMENGKHTAIEVPSATTLEECWALVNASEKTRKHCMMLENCCYDFFELQALEMARQGVLGEIIHAEGSYHHNLSDYWHEYWHNWRLAFNSEHKGDIYPTHGLGPITQALNIHRGDKFRTLVAMETASFNGKASAELYRDSLIKYQGAPVEDFANGDLTMTTITTENGKTILVEHDVLNPRPYNRMYQLVGTKGYAAKYPVEQFSFRKEVLDEIGIKYDSKNFNQHGPLSDDIVAQMRSLYKTPILDDELAEKARTVGGHGGMDFIMDYRLIYCLHYGLPLDMDVYDLAEWCSIGPLGEISILNGNAPVECPDFTRGAWKKQNGFRYAFADGSFK